MRKSTFLVPVLVGALAAVAACTVHKSDVPPLTGPSEFGTSIGVAVIPDSISRDGASQAAVVITAHDAGGKVLPSVPIRLDMAVNGSLQDFGTLSARTVVTGSDGTARAVYTAPAPPPPSVPVSISFLTIVATPTGSNAQTAVARTADIRLVPVGVILPTGQTPTPKFTFAPPTPAAGSPVQFDASASCPSPLTVGGACPTGGAITSYQWDFGDGATGSGKTVSHVFAVQQTYGVTLTVTNDQGAAASVTQAVTTGAGTPPSGNFSFSPAKPNAKDTVFFNADAIQPGPGRTLVAFNWNFGDGGTASGFQVTHVFAAAGTYTVVLSVLDDVGQKKTFTLPIDIASGNPTASFVTSSSGLLHGIRFDGSGSTATGTATITQWQWDFGDGSPGGSGQVVSHQYLNAGTYTVTLTVTDSLGRVGRATQPVTVP